jgi:16S rRNA processing protein RimM
MNASEPLPRPKRRERRAPQPSPQTADVAPAPPGRTAPTHLLIGRVIAPRGVAGELRVFIESDDPQRFLRLPRVLVQPATGEDAPAPEDPRAFTVYTVQSARLHRGEALLYLEGVANRDTAETLRGASLWVAREEAIPLEEGEFYHYQVVGLTVITEAGEVLGEVREILAMPANDVYVVRGPGSELLLPAIKDVVLKIDVPAGQMVVRLLAGMREE